MYRDTSVTTCSRPSCSSVRRSPAPCFQCRIARNPQGCLSDGLDRFPCSGILSGRDYAARRNACRAAWIREQVTPLHLCFVPAWLEQGLRLQGPHSRKYAYLSPRRLKRACSVLLASSQTEVSHAFGHSRLSGWPFHGCGRVACLASADRAKFSACRIRHWSPRSSSLQLKERSRRSHRRRSRSAGQQQPCVMSCVRPVYASLMQKFHPTLNFPALDETVGLW